MGEPSAILMVDIWLGRAQVAKSLSPVTYVAPKMVLTMGSTSEEHLPQTMFHQIIGLPIVALLWPES